MSAVSGVQKINFLSKENRNHVLQQIFSYLNKQGINIDIKEEQRKIEDFMNKVNSRWPSGVTDNLNEFVVKKCINQYVKHQSSLTHKPDIKDAFEHLRQQYEAPRQNNGPPTLDQQPLFSQEQPTSMQPPSIQSSSNPGHFSLSQVRGGDELEAPEPTIPSNSHSNHESRMPSSNLEEKLNTSRKHLNEKSYDKKNYNWVSLTKDDLINVSNNTLTFSWDKKILMEEAADSSSIYRFQLKYMTLPKYYPYLLVNARASNDHSIYSGSGKAYSGKLIPHHTLGEYTTYQCLGNIMELGDLPDTISFQVIPPLKKSSLGLNEISVQRVIKKDQKLHIITKHPHNLQSSDSLTLEFPHNSSCYKITNLEILDDHQFRMNSPFAGYFNANFKLLRNNWTLDLTMICV